MPSESASPATTGVGRWWIAVGCALVAAVPLGWLLSYGAALVAMLGLYFFALFGIILGGVMFRMAAPVRPIPTYQLRLGAGIVVVFCWCLSMAVEVHEFPTDKANQAVEQTPMLPEGQNVTEFRQHVADFVRETLRRDYGSSGFWGYARWVLASSKMHLEVETLKRPIVLKSVHYRWWWGFRAIASIGFLAFGVYAVVQPLSGTKDPAGAANPPKN